MQLPTHGFAHKLMTIDLPPHGFVRYVERLGTDQTVVEAARVSYGAPSKGPLADEKLLNYLLQHRHTSPFEQCNITFNIKFPIFLMRQFVRHRTFRLNEVSARYTKLPEEFFLPSEWRLQNKTGNKQGSEEDITGDLNQEACTRDVNELYERAYDLYESLCLCGVANEQARMVLPVAIYTEIRVNIDLHNLMHFFKLRLDSHAQSEMRDVAEAMLKITEKLYPWTMKAFITHVLCK